MRHASFPAVRHAFLASALLVVGLAGSAFAQGPAPSCDLTGATTIHVGETTTLCGITGAGLTYSWHDSSGTVLLTEGGQDPHVNCHTFGPYAVAGVHNYLYTISQGPAFLKCPVQITVIDNPPPPSGKCWLTGGGAKTDAFSGWHSFGGNVNPGCSPTAGDGGNWNDIAHDLNLHFQGKAITVLACGNVDGIPAGSKSPKTPFNYIEFTGTGTLKGVSGNDTDYENVYFWAHYEDRGEPGKDDHYFLNVYTNPADPAGSSVMLVDGDGNAATMDPVQVSRGNLQLHISGCDKNQATAPAVIRGDVDRDAIAMPTEISFAPAAPNPSIKGTLFRFGLPREATVSLRVFDVAGRQVRELVSGRVPAGLQSISWDLHDDAGKTVSRGLYFARLVVDGAAHNRSVTVTN